MDIDTHRNQDDGPALMNICVIGNPTGSHGKGKHVIAAVRKAIVEEIGEDCVWSFSTHEFLHNQIVSRLFGAGPHDKLDPSSMHKESATIPERPITPLGGGAVRATVTSTDAHGDGVRAAQHMAQMATEARLVAGSASFRYNRGLDMESSGHIVRDGGKHENVVHVVVVVGGDGTVSEVINGLCRGVLAVYRRHCDLLPFGTFPALDERTSEQYYWRVLEERAILRHLLPPVLYVPIGTGADFARLRLCCPTVEHFSLVLRGIIQDFFSSQLNHAPASPDDEITPSNSLFVTYEVDVGRITFPKTGHLRFFVNVCSIGMSCDVIERSERFKGNTCLAALGGTFIFALSSLLSLFHVKPRPVRMARLSPFPVQPWMGDPAVPMRTRGAPYMPTHLCRTDVALVSLQHDLQWLIALRDACHAGHQHPAIMPAMDPALRHALGRVDHFSLRTSNYYRYDPETPIPLGPHFGDDPIVCNGVAVLRPSRFYRMSSPVSRSAATSTCRPIGACTWAEDANSIRDDLGLQTTLAPAPLCTLQWVGFNSSTIAFANGRWFGGGMLVAPDADPTDGLLSCTNWVATMRVFVCRCVSLYTGGHKNWPSTTTMDGERFIVDVCPSPEHAEKESATPPAMMMEADGELLEELPAVVEIGTVITFLAPNISRRFGKRSKGRTPEANTLQEQEPTVIGNKEDQRRASIIGKLRHMMHPVTHPFRRLGALCAQRLLRKRNVCATPPAYRPEETPI